MVGRAAAPTAPPDTMKPDAPVASAAAQSLWRSAYWKVPKNRISGRKSRKSFIGGARGIAGGRSGTHGSGLVGGVEVYRRRVDAEPLARRLGPVLEHVAQVGAAVVAPHLDAHHAVALVDDPFHPLAVDGLEIAGPAAAGVELRAGV